MSNPIKGAIAVISDYGIGKTTFALECGYPPEDITFINDDLKETGFEGEFGRYVDLVEKSSRMKLMDFHKYCNDLIDKLPKSKVIIWDTWTAYQDTMAVYVKTHPNEFRGGKEYNPKGSIKGGEQYTDAYRYEGGFITALKKKCDLLILTFHLKQAYRNNVAVPGKFRPGHDKAIEKYTDLRIWLTPNPHSQVPIGLVMKNLGKRTVTEGRIKTKQVLPLRIEKCNWETIETYWENPIGDRNPTKFERPNAFELSLIRNTLTPEQEKRYEAILPLAEKQLEKDTEDELLLANAQRLAVKKYVEDNLNGKPLPLKMSAVRAAIENGELEYDGEVTMDLLG